MNFLITGIKGFVGGNLSQLLYDNGHNVYGLIRGSNGNEAELLGVITPDCFEDIVFCYGDLENYQSLEKVFQDYNFDGCFHLAAQSHPPTSFIDPIGTLKTNVIGSANLFDVISKYNPECKILACSTSEVYGNSGSDGRLLKETDKIEPSNVYGTSKSAMDLHFQERLINKKNVGFITRSFSHTGVGRGKKFSISSDAYQVARIMKGLQEPIIEVGNLETIRTVIDVRDVCQAYYSLMINENSNGEIFNVCGSIARKMKFFTDYLIKLSDIDIEKKVSDKYYRPIDIFCQIADCSKLKSLTGWEAKIPIERTLEDLLNYWLKKIN